MDNNIPNRKRVSPLQTYHCRRCGEDSETADKSVFVVWLIEHLSQKCCAVKQKGVAK